jgi:hypothetical protein
VPLFGFRRLRKMMAAMGERGGGTQSKAERTSPLHFNTQPPDMGKFFHMIIAIVCRCVIIFGCWTYPLWVFLPFLLCLATLHFDFLTICY